MENDIFNQEILNETLDLNLVFSANIICKILNHELLINKNCLGDWLESLTDKEINMLADYFNQFRGEAVEEEESEDLMAQDLAACLEFLYLLECGESDDFDGERIPDMLEFLDMACNLDILRREDKINIIEKPKISDKNSGLYEGKNLTGRKARGKKS